MLIDTHAHLYAEEFVDDRNEIIRNALQAGVQKIVLPNIDEESIDIMLELSSEFPGVCFPLMGLHPTSVGENYKNQLATVEQWLGEGEFFGIGETGIDLYWDKTYHKEQEDAFRIQLKIARLLHKPVVIHVRNSFNEVYNILKEEQDGNLSGVFHCFSGTLEEAKKIIDVGFFMGIGGVVTFKNSNLMETLRQVDIKHILLETDAPYLAPVPYRGRRNESAYLFLVAEKIAAIYNLDFATVSDITSANAVKLFSI